MPHWPNGRNKRTLVVISSWTETKGTPSRVYCEARLKHINMKTHNHRHAPTGFWAILNQTNTLSGRGYWTRSNKQTPFWVVFYWTQSSLVKPKTTKHTLSWWCWTECNKHPFGALFWFEPTTTPSWVSYEIKPASTHHPWWVPRSESYDKTNTPSNQNQHPYDVSLVIENNTTHVVVLKLNSRSNKHTTQNYIS